MKNDRKLTFEEELQNIDQYTWMTPLCAASNLGKFTALLNRGALVTPAVCAAAATIGTPAFIETLFQLNNEVVEREKENMLFSVILLGKSYVLEGFKGVDISQMKRGDGMTPLHYAVFGGSPRMVEAILEKGVDLYGKMDDGMNALHCAVELQNLEIVSLLVEKGMDVNQKDEAGYTPLHYAAEKNNEKIIEYLIERGAILDAMTVKGLTPLEIAKKYGMSPNALNMLTVLPSMYISLF